MLTRRAVTVLVTLDVLREELRRYWRRLLVGALAGWVVATVLGSVVLVALELETGYAAGVVSASVLVWVGIGAGALVAYSIRRERG